MTTRTFWRTIAAMLLIAATLAAVRGAAPAVARQEATPIAASCDDVPPLAGTPSADMDIASPSAETAELDQLYIDMMIPHHASIVALSEAALPRLHDGRLRTIAQDIIDAQTAEVAELRGYRAAFYGSPDPLPLDEAAMMRLTPGAVTPMDEMMGQMDAATQVAAFCAAADADLAFFDLTIPHHESAISASQTASAGATHPEIVAFARRVIVDQQREIDELTAIRAELSGAATPDAAAADDHPAHADAAAAGASVAGVEIRALTPEEIGQIERGEGAGFALPAERNGVPGPRHTLDLAVELGLTVDQIEQVQRLLDAMRLDAIAAGERYLAAQRALEQDFRDGALTEATLPGRVAEVSRLEGEIAAVHLTAHLRTAEILTAGQITTYQTLRQAA